jgi:hypothetical protein
MALDLRDCTFFGPALPEPFVKFELERHLTKRKLLPHTRGDDGKAVADAWESYRRKLRALGEQGGDRRVANHVLEPLVDRLGYATLTTQPEVATREGMEAGGLLFEDGAQGKLRAWAWPLGTDLDAPSRRGRAYRYSPSRVAQRVLLAQGERVGLLTDGEELRLLLCDPARPDSHIAVRLDRSGGWRAARSLPDSYRLVLALASPAGVTSVPDLVEEARLAQSGVTKKLRKQARQAVRRFVQEVLDHPANAAALAARADNDALARDLWHEGLVLVYRLLFVLKLESSADPARAFTFAATSLWRNTYSPNTALAPVVRRVVDDGADTGGLLEGGLRTLFRMFAQGLSSSELHVSALGGALFGAGTAPVLDGLRWGEHAVAALLDSLLWTPGDGRTERERVHYGSLDVEDLGRVYEALLELEPGIAAEPMCRLRRAKLEVVVPLAQGQSYRHDIGDEDDADDEGENDVDDGEETAAAGRGKTKVQWIEEIPAGRFFMRVGLGRKASGSYYTPRPFVRFLVQETLGPQIAERSHPDDPQPGKLLELKVLDPAMGSGHFLVEACRHLGEALYEACRLCDERALETEDQAEKTKDPSARAGLLERARALRQRVEDLPDPNDELVAYLPSRAAEGAERGPSQKKAEALCRRLVAVHCLYGVDKNPLAVELAKLSLWLESYAEGWPLTFLDHRLICGDSLTGPFLSDLFTLPVSGAPLGEDLLTQGLKEKLEAALGRALARVKDLTASIGKDISDLEQKATAKAALDEALASFRSLARTWAGAKMADTEAADRHWLAHLGELFGRDARAPDVRTRYEEAAGDAITWELVFPEVFHGRLSPSGDGGFHAVIGNPPWDKPHAELQLLLGSFDLSALDIRNSVDLRARAESLFESSENAREAWLRLEENAKRSRHTVISIVRAAERETHAHIGAAHVDLFMAFSVRAHGLCCTGGRFGMVLSGGLAKNPAATPVRALWIRNSSSSACLQFDNRSRLFEDLPGIIEFCVMTAAKSALRTYSPPRVGLALSRFEDLVDQSLPVADYRAIEESKLLTFADLLVPPSDTYIESLWSLISRSCSHLLQEVYPSRADITLIRELLPGGSDPRGGAGLRTLLCRGYIPVLEGRSVGQFDGLRTSDHSRWDPTPTQALRVSASEPARARSLYFRLALRRKVGSPRSNARSLAAAVIPPHLACSDSLMVEDRPQQRCTHEAMVCASVLNSFVADSLVRPHVQVMVTTKLLDAIPAPAALSFWARLLLCHASVRLHSVSVDYLPMWREQFADAWREPTPCHTWPVLADEETRWAVRAAIDAVVADAYGLSRKQYAHVLDSFSHRSYPTAPDLCLAAYDELKSIGLDAFVKKHDPYWDIALVDTLPKPVIDLPTPERVADDTPAWPPPMRAQTALPLSRPAPPVDEGQAYATLRDLLAARGLISSGDAQQATGLDAVGVRPHLQCLVAEGLAVTEGQRRGMKYRWNG